MRKNWKPLSALLWSLLLVACGSSGPAEVTPVTDSLEQNAVNMVQLSSPEQANAAIGLALQRYRTLDDLHGQWRMLHLRTSYALANGTTLANGSTLANGTTLAKGTTLANGEDLGPGLSELETLASQLNDQRVTYQTHLLLGQFQDDSHYREALRFAVTPAERAVAQTYLGNHGAALAQLEGASSGNQIQDAAPADVAFVYYRYAAANDSKRHFETALAHYRRAEDTRGVADSLVALARLAHRDRNPSQARALGERAVRVLQASGDQHRAKAVEHWLSTVE